MNWDGWSMERVLVLFVSLAYLLVGIQVTLYHYRQNFHQKVMWVPVITAPLIGLAGLVFGLVYAAWLKTVFIALMWIGIAIGLAGFYFHFKGVGDRVGGWTLNNFLIGPPVILPLLFSALGVLGLIAMYGGERG